MKTKGLAVLVAEDSVDIFSLFVPVFFPCCRCHIVYILLIFLVLLKHVYLFTKDIAKSGFHI
ncbi:MAG TPA: hypothetical protein DEO70_12110 [Bacteroidales bacterium]|nr:MAG: hypothetical protein A2X11_10100 [Bacteroidetes bacterium GWE2_42_24]OFY25864.1 MAG: hypothetical protein A2X09_09475 [Bacteroidetes bacterium GWF2_43_11]HBZ67572.1 hypothetical protein [Bacteroidales bacterium]